MASEIFEGRCQCGQARYRISGETVALFVCHCTECQRQSASAFGMALWLRNFSKELLAGELEAWVRTTPRGRQLVGEFCPRCGTRLFHQMTDQPDTMSIKPGTLDTPLAFEPVAHIWTSSAQAWAQWPPSTLSYPENPPSFEDIFAAWQARKKQGSVSTSSHRRLLELDAGHWLTYEARNVCNREFLAHLQAHPIMTDGRVTVRRAALADVSALVPLFDAYRQFYGQSSNPEAARAFLVERLQRGESTLFIAEAAARPAGFVQLFPTFSSVSLAPTFILNDLFVVPEHRRSGIAQALLSAAVEFAREAGAVRVSLSTAVTNGPAQALYEACGWAKQADYHVYVLKL